MSFWKKFKLIASGFLSGLLLILGLHVFRKSHHGGGFEYPHQDLDDEFEDIEEEHKQKLEEIKDKINNTSLEEKLEETNEKASRTSPWSGVNIVIPDNFRATKS